jgi:hypothetical protein
VKNILGQLACDSAQRLGTGGGREDIGFRSWYRQAILDHGGSGFFLVEDPPVRSMSIVVRAGGIAADEIGACCHRDLAARAVVVGLDRAMTSAM